jgi:large subunit ribosomal protein L2
MINKLNKRYFVTSTYKESLSKFKNNTKYLYSSLKKNAGRNNSGKITVYHKGGGNKRRYKNIDFKQVNNGIVVNIEYDSNRTAYIAKIYCLKSKKYYYTIAPRKLNILDNISENINLNQIGSRHPLSNFSIGDFIYNIEIMPGRGASLVRAAGTSAQVISKNNQYVTLRLPSGEHRMFLKNCKASLGIISNEKHKNLVIGKAGKSRGLNNRPTVRGVAMNPIDHPHGGGEGKSSGGRPSVTP